jgi:hypothetical protein
MEDMKVRGKLTWVSPMRTWTAKNGRSGGSCTVKIDIDEGRYTDDFCGEISEDEAGYMKKQGIKMGDMVELTYRVTASYSEKTEAWYSRVRVKAVDKIGAETKREDPPARPNAKQAEDGEDLPF